MNIKVREIVYAKYKGHCAYCGCELEMKDMQIDHIVPKYRNYEKWAKEIGCGSMPKVANLKAIHNGLRRYLII